MDEEAASYGVIPEPRDEPGRKARIGAEATTTSEAERQEMESFASIARNREPDVFAFELRGGSHG
jgi:hypothetical protein